MKALACAASRKCYGSSTKPVFEIWSSEVCLVVEELASAFVASGFALDLRKISNIMIK
jgi:hypothetical protein